MCAVEVKNNKFTLTLDKNGKVIREPATLAKAKWNFYVYGRQERLSQPLITKRHGNIKSWLFGKEQGSLCYLYYLESNKTISNLSQMKLALENSLTRDLASGVIDEKPTINFLQNKKQYITITCKDGQTELEIL